MAARVSCAPCRWIKRSCVWGGYAEDAAQRTCPIANHAHASQCVTRIKIPKPAATLALSAPLFVSASILYGAERRFRDMGIELARWAATVCAAYMLAPGTVRPQIREAVSPDVRPHAVKSNDSYKL